MSVELDLNFAGVIMARKLAAKKDVDLCLKAMIALRPGNPALTLADYMVSKKILTRAVVDKVLRENPELAPRAAKGAKPAAAVGGPTTGGGFQVCSICGKEMRPGHFLKNCDLCGTGYHMECFLNNGGCARAACRPEAKKAGTVTDGRVLMDLGAAARKRKLLINGAVLVGVLVLLYAAWAGYQAFGRSAGSLLEEARVHTGRKIGESFTHLFARKRGAAGDEGRAHAEQAKVLLVKAERKSPTDVETLGELAAVQFDLGDAAQALETLKRLAPEGTTPAPEVDQALGAMACETGDFKLAEAAWSRAVGTAKDSVPLRLALISLCEGELKEPAGALPHLRALVAASPDDNALALRLVTALLKQDKADDAVPLLQKLLAAAALPQDEAVQLIRTLLERKRPADAAKVARPLVAGGGTSAEIQRLCAQAFLAAGQVDEALVQLRALLTVAPTDTEAALALGKALLDKGEATEALDRLTAAAEALKGSPESLLLLARCRLGLSQPKEALEALDKLPGGGADVPEAAPLAARAAMEVGDLPRAERALRAALARTPDDLPLLALNVQRLRLTGDLPGSVEACKAALARHKDAAPLLRELGLDYKAQDRLAAALAAFRTAAAADPEAAFELAEIYQAFDLKEPAAEHYRRYLEKVTQGAHAERARSFTGADAGGAPAGGANPQAARAAALTEIQGLLATPPVKDQDPLDCISAGLAAASYFSAVACKDNDALNPIGARFDTLFNKYRVGRTGLSNPGNDANRSAMLEISASENGMAWAAELREMTLRLKAALAKGDAGAKAAPALAAALEGFPAKVDTQNKMLDRAAAAAHSCCDLLLAALAQTGATDAIKADAATIGRATELQESFCENAFERFASSLVMIDRCLALLVATRDAKGKYATRRAAELSALEAADDAAANVIEQARASTLRLVRLMSLLADPALQF